MRYTMHDVLSTFHAGYLIRWRYRVEVVRPLMPGKRFSLHAAMTLMSPIMDAVSYLHRQHPPLIHGDIKPSNIIAPTAGAPTPLKLVDFGGVKNLCTDATAQHSALNFRAPEQYGGKASRSADVYALGAIFYTLLTGEVPAAASDRLARLNAGAPDPLLPMNQSMPSVQMVAHAIHRALSISSHDRFATVEQFREALWQVLPANQMVTQTPELPMVGSAGEHMGPLVFEPMIPLSIEEKNTGPDVNLVATQTPELPMIPLPIEEKNTGPDAILVSPQTPTLPLLPLPNIEKNTGPGGNPIATQTPELPMVGPDGERTGLDAEPDVSIVEVEIPTLIANATIQAEVTPPLSPAFLAEGKSPVKVSSQEGSPVLLRGERHLPNNGSADGKDKRQKRKARTLSLDVLVFFLLCTIGTGFAIVAYQTSKTYKNDVVLAQVGIKHLQRAVSFMQTWSK